MMAAYARAGVVANRVARRCSPASAPWLRLRDSATASSTLVDGAARTARCIERATVSTVAVCISRDLLRDSDAESLWVERVVAIGRATRTAPEDRRRPVRPVDVDGIGQAAAL